MMHTLHSYFTPEVDHSKREDKPLPDPNGLLSSNIPLQLSEMPTMCTLDLVNKSKVVNISDHEVPM